MLLNVKFPHDELQQVFSRAPSIPIFVARHVAFNPGSERTKTVYATFSILLSKSEELPMYLSSPFAEILHKPARKNPTMTPIESHARNHIGHPLPPLTRDSHFLSSTSEFPSLQGELQITCQ